MILGGRVNRRSFDFDLYRARVYVRARHKHLMNRAPLSDADIYHGVATAVKETLFDKDLRIDGENRERVKEHLRNNAAGWVAEYRNLMSTN